MKKIAFYLFLLSTMASIAWATLPTRFDNDVIFGGAVLPKVNGQALGSSTFQWTIFGAVSSARNIFTTAPLAGGGNLGSDLTLSVAQASSTLNGYVASGDFQSFSLKEPAITAGSSTQYRRADKTNQTLDTSVVPENGNLYFTNARAHSTFSGNAPLVYSVGTGNFSISKATASIDGYLAATDFTTFNNKVSSTRNVNTSTPLAGGGSLASDLTLSLPQGSSTQAGYIASADFLSHSLKVSTTRNVNTTAPLAGGGNLGSDLTISIPAATNVASGYLSASGQSVGGNKTFYNNFTLQEVSTPATPSAGFINLYPKSDGSVYVQTPDGNEQKLGSGAGGGGSGVTTMAAVGSSPSANGATISGTTLTLQPSDDTHPGVTTILAQKIAGMKEFLSAFLMDEVSTPPQPSSSTQHNLYFKSTDHNLYMLNGQSVEVQLTGGSTINTTDWIPYIPTLSNGFGTTSAVSFFWRRIGDSIQVVGTLTTGVATANLATISLPNGYTIDATKLQINTSTGNLSARIGDLTEATANTIAPIVASTGTSTSVVYMGGLLNAANFNTPHNGNAVLNNSAVEQVQFYFPAVGLSGAGGLGSGMAASDWISDTTNITPSAGFGTISNFKAFRRRVGDTIEWRGDFTIGTIAASPGFITLSAGYLIDTTKVSSNTQTTSLGWANQLTSGSNGVWTANTGLDAFYDGSTNSKVFISWEAASNLFQENNVTAWGTTGNKLSFNFSYPVSGWTSNPFGTGAPLDGTRYTGSATSISGSLAAITFATQDTNFSQAMSSGVYTCPITGKYQVTGNIQVTGTIALNSAVEGQILVNSTAQIDFQDFAGGAMTAQNIVLNGAVYCALGSTISIKASSGATLPVITNSSKTWVSIVRVQ